MYDHKKPPVDFLTELRRLDAERTRALAMCGHKESLEKLGFIQFDWSGWSGTSKKKSGWF